jgi:AraC-like DNA-binding protein
MREKSNQIKAYNDFIIIYGYGLSKKMHANHGVKLIIGEQAFSVIYDQKIINATGVIIRSNTLHEVKAGEGLSITIYLDAESEIGKEINGNLKKGTILKLENEAVNMLLSFFTYPFESHFTEPEIKNLLIKTLLNKEILEQVPRTLDERIEKAIMHIKSSSNYNVKFSDLLDLCSLSESRLIHLFKKEIGITIRKYIVWCRLQKSLKAMASGLSIKEAALLAGFTDAAHLNRSFVSMFGINPSSMLK